MTEALPGLRVEREKGQYMSSILVRVPRDEDGQALVEYALILFFVALVCIGVLTALGQGVSGVLQSIVTEL